MRRNARNLTPAPARVGRAGTLPGEMPITVRPITDSDRRPVAEFLQAHLSDRITADAWARYLVVPWKVDAPNHGFQLLDGDAVVGVYLAFYCERTIDGRP